MKSESGIRFQIIHNVDELEELLFSWQLLDRRNPPETTYLSPDFLIPWLRYVQQQRTLSVVLMYEREKLTGIAPLVRDVIKCGPIRIRRLSLAGFGEACPTLDIRTYENQAHLIVSEFLKYRESGVHPWSILALRRLSGNSAFLRFLPDVCREQGLSLIWEPARRESYLRMEGSWQDYLKRLPKNHRNELSRGRKNLDRTTDWHFSCDWPSKTTVSQVLRDYQDILARSWKKMELDSPGLYTFRKDLFTRFASRGDLLVTRLQGPEGPGAMLITFREGCSLFSYVMAYAQDCPVRGSGTVLLGHTIAYAYEKNFAIYDFSTGGEHIHRWSPLWRNTWNVYIVRRSPMGKVLQFLMAYRRRQRKKIS